jgi:hypothetical protein
MITIALRIMIAMGVLGIAYGAVQAQSSYKLTRTPSLNGRETWAAEYDISKPLPDPDDPTAKGATQANSPLDYDSPLQIYQEDARLRPHKRYPRGPEHKGIRDD